MERITFVCDLICLIGTTLSILENDEALEEISEWVNDETKKAAFTLRKSKSGPQLISPDMAQSNKVPTSQGNHLVLEENHTELDDISDLEP